MTANGYPPILIKVDDRPNYFEALRSAQKSGDTRPFIYFIFGMALRSIDEYKDELHPLILHDPANISKKEKQNFYLKNLNFHFVDKAHDNDLVVANS